MNDDFIHLRVQSSYSFLESALTIEKIVKIAKNHSMNALCLADRGNLFGSLEFSIEASKYGLQPIHGSIMNLAYFDKITKKIDFAELLLIAKDEIGYKNLLKLVSYGFIKNDRNICNHITYDDLKLYNEGLIALSCYNKGITGKYLLKNDIDRAIEYTKELKNIFSDRFYFEIMRHSLKEEELIEDDYINIALDLSIPLVATNNVLFSDISVYEAHDVLLCIAQGVTKEHEIRKRASNQSYFKSKQEMIGLFSDIPEAIENTINLAQRCYVMSSTNAPMLPHFGTKAISEDKLIREQSEQGLLKKLEIKFKNENISPSKQEEIRQQYFERLNYELDIICKMNFAGYFLIVSDFIKWSKEQGILVGPGRGSGAGSVVAWCLLITDPDPIKFVLLFERFLNPERISMPDFDIDICQERRDEVINYVREKYGHNRVGQIITFGKLQAKAAIKDVSRVLSLPYKYADYLTELVPFNAVNPVTLEQAINEVVELRNAFKGKGLYNLKENEALIKQVLSTSLILEGLHRHASTHAAGIVISGEDLIEIVPVCKDANSDMFIVQYSMKYAELAGLVKFDFLGLQNLTTITKCLALLKEKGIEIDFDKIGFKDKKTYEMLSKGESTGVFQFEGVGMKNTLRRVKPDSIGDLIAIGALYRPGPMENIPTYAACKHDLQKPDYLHPLLEPILKDTYGVIIYQEQVLEIAKVLAGYTLGAADLLRKAMGKKIKAEMQAQEKIFVAGAVANKLDEKQSRSIFEILAKFAGYGFNRAHATAYGIISYRTGYLKANFPKEFLVACLNLELDNSDKIVTFIQEVRNNNIKIIPPDINLSKGFFSISGEDIVYAIGAIKNVTKIFGDVINTEREKRGIFKNIIDFVERIEPKFINKKLLENIIKAGAFDSLHDNRNQLLENIPKILAYALSFHEEKHSKQFNLISVNVASNNLLAEVKPKDHISMAFEEFDVMGMFVKKHPLTEYEQLLKDFDIKDSIYLDGENFALGSRQIKIAGVIQKKDSRMSPRGRFISLQLSDQFGIFSITVYSDEVLKNHAHLLETKNIVIATCDLLKDNGGIKLTGKSFASIDEVNKTNKISLELYPKNIEDLSKLLEIIKNKETDSGNVKLIIHSEVDKNLFAKIDLPKYFQLSQAELSNLGIYRK